MTPEAAKKVFDGECAAIGQDAAAKLLRAVNRYQSTMASIKLSNMGKKKGAAPKDRPKLRKQPVQTSARKG